MAQNYNCKYKISLGHKHEEIPEADRGYIFLQVEQYGFDEDVLVMVQQHDKFENHVLNSDKYSHTKIYRSYFGY